MVRAPLVLAGDRSGQIGLPWLGRGSGPPGGCRWTRERNAKEHTLTLTTISALSEERDELTRLAEAIIDGLGTTGPLSADESALAETLGLRGVGMACRCA
jgi:hypothetical protein